MVAPIVPVSQINKSYQIQIKIGELNRQRNIKTAQGQADQISISQKARQMLATLEYSSNINEPAQSEVP